MRDVVLVGSKLRKNRAECAYVNVEYSGLQQAFRGTIVNYGSVCRFGLDRELRPTTWETLERHCPVQSRCQRVTHRPKLDNSYPVLHAYSPFAAHKMLWATQLLYTAILLRMQVL